MPIIAPARVRMPAPTDGLPFYRRSDVGLTAEHPFRFSTLRWDAPSSRGVTYRGDSEGDLKSRCVEIDMAAKASIEDIPLHRHEFYEFVLCRAGTGKHISSAGEVPFERGRVAMVIPGAAHGFCGLHGTLKTNLYLDTAWFQRELWLHSSDHGLVRTLLARSIFAVEECDRVLLLDLDEEAVATCEAEFVVMRNEADEENPSLLTFNAGFLKVMDTFARAARADSAWSDEPLNPIVWRGARLVERLIEAENPFSMETLARGLGLSVTHMNRLFREHAGVTPAQHYQNRRIHHACRMLTAHNDSLASIANRLQFADQSHFSRAFRDAVGMSPGQFRRTQQDPAHTHHPERHFP